jgi:pyruvate kinase
MTIRRQRHAKIVATLGPARSSEAMIRALFVAGADVFRLNFSHGTHEQHRERLDLIRKVEREVGRSIGVLADMQGPKLRVGMFANGPVTLAPGAAFRLDLDATPGDATRANLPHREIFAALRPGANLLLDDGKLRLQVKRAARIAPRPKSSLAGRCRNARALTFLMSFCRCER